MAVQTKILKRTFGQEVKVQTGVDAEGNPTYEIKKFQSATGALIGGTPGQIYDVAYGPVCHTTNLASAADIGTFVEGSGVIVNAPEYALYGQPGAPLAASLTLPANTVVSVMTAGHIWVKRGSIDAIREGMNTFVIYEPEGTDENDLCVVEVNGLVSKGDDSSAQG